MISEADERNILSKSEELLINPQLNTSDAQERMDLNDVSPREEPAAAEQNIQAAQNFENKFFMRQRGPKKQLSVVEEASNDEGSDSINGRQWQHRLNLLNNLN